MKRTTASYTMALDTNFGDMAQWCQGQLGLAVTLPGKKQNQSSSFKAPPRKKPNVACWTAQDSTVASNATARSS